MKHIALSWRQYPEDFLEDATLKERRLSELSDTIGTLTRQIAVLDRLLAGKDPCPQEMLKDSEFMSAEQKKKMLRQWDRFIERAFGFELFTNTIYQHLNLHCGFIAHYNRSGFYSTYWNGDFIAFARKTSMLIRPVPTVFFNWERFLSSFRCWGEWAPMGASMLHALKSHLVSTLKEMEREVKDSFRHDLERLYPSTWQRGSVWPTRRTCTGRRSSSSRRSSTTWTLTVSSKRDRAATKSFSRPSIPNVSRKPGSRAISSEGGII